MDLSELLQQTFRPDKGSLSAPPEGGAEEVPSPFLAGTKIQYAWDSTSLGAFKKCPRYYQYKLIDGWTRSTDNIHLRWGQEFHTALEDYDRGLAEGAAHDDAIHDSLRALLSRIEGWDPDPNLTKRSEALKTKEALVRAVVWYLDHYEDDPARTVRLANGKPAVEVSFSFELDYGPQIKHSWMLSGKGLPGEWWVCHKCGEERHESERDPNNPGTCGPNYLLCGHLDRIVDFNGGLYVMDRKTTTTTVGSYFFDRFSPDNQMSLYSLAGQIVLGSPIRGVIIDAIQLLVDTVRPVRGFTYRTPDQLEEWLADTKRWLRQAEGCATEGHWPMNDTACDKFGGCEFREICSRSPGVREKFLEGGFRKEEPWNPLKPR